MKTWTLSGRARSRATAAFLLIALAGCGGAGGRQSAETADTSVARHSDAGSTAGGAGDRDSSARGAGSGDTARAMTPPVSMRALWDRIETQDAALATAVAARQLAEAGERANNLRDLVAVYVGRADASPAVSSRLDGLAEELDRGAKELADASGRGNATAVAASYARMKITLANIAGLRPPS
jgi:hypothetical protein